MAAFVKVLNPDTEKDVAVVVDVCFELYLIHANILKLIVELTKYFLEVQTFEDNIEALDVVILLEWRLRFRNV